MFSFNNPIFALGLDITILGISNSLVTVGGSVTDSIALVENTPAFWGVIDVDRINSISFDPSGSGFIGFDAVSYGTASAVPSPAAIWLFSSGLIGFIGMRRKSSKLLTISASS